MGNSTKNIRRGIGKKIVKNIFRRTETGVFIALILIGIVISISSPQFLNLTNFINIFRQASVLGIMTMGITLLMISGEFDLSIGSTFAVAPILFVDLMSREFPISLALILSLLIGTLFGFINGLLVTRTRVHSFIITVGTLMIYRGVALVISGGWPKSLDVIGVSGNFVIKALGQGRLFGIIPIPIFWFIAIVIICWIVLAKTTHGFKNFATGGNIEAAKISGINTNMVKIVNFMIVGFLAAFAGIISLAYLGTSSPTMGSGYELEAIAATVVGGTALGGGAGSIIGALIGTLIIATIRNGLVLNMVDVYYQQAALGAVIIIAVIINAQISIRFKR